MNYAEKQQLRSNLIADYVPCGDDYLDEEIKDTVQTYFDSLINGDRGRFCEKPMKERLHDICWRWGQNPETMDDSIRLKAQIFARALAQPILVSFPFLLDHKGIPALDDYWNRVDHDLQTELRGLAERHNGTYEESVIANGATQAASYRALVHINDFNIYRRDLMREGQLLHIDYIACLASRNVLDVEY